MPHKTRIKRTSPSVEDDSYLSASINRAEQMVTERIYKTIIILASILSVAIEYFDLWCKRIVYYIQGRGKCGRSRLGTDVSIYYIRAFNAGSLPAPADKRVVSETGTAFARDQLTIFEGRARARA